MYATGTPMTFTAGAAIPKGRFVKLNTSGQVILAAAVTDNCIGVSQETGTTGNVIAVAMIDGSSIVEVEASEAVTAGALVGPTADGSARIADTSGDAVLGIAVVAAAADGEFASVLLQKSATLVA